MRLLLLSLLLLLVSCQKTPDSDISTSALAVSTPSAEGFDATALDSVIQRADTGYYGYTDRILVLKNGKVIADRDFDLDYREISRGKSHPVLGCGYQTCPDTSNVDAYNYFHPEVHPYYRGSDLHSLQSVTKSVAATIIGIAIDRGDLPDVETKVLDYLQDYDLNRIDPTWREVTLEDVLTMRLGLAWNENTSPLDSNNNVVQLEDSPDWIQYTLNQPFDTVPGTRWVYNSGASQLLSGIIRQATGQDIADYGRTHLFEPLGISEFHWKKTPTGLNDTEGGLYLKAEDLARIGMLYLQEGTWEGNRILSQEWVDAATARQVNDIYEHDTQEGYGYQWWRAPFEEAVWLGIGFGNQFLIVLPADNLVAVAYGWNVFDDGGQYILLDFLQALLKHSR